MLTFFIVFLLVASILLFDTIGRALAKSPMQMNDVHDASHVKMGSMIYRPSFAKQRRAATDQRHEVIIAVQQKNLDTLEKELLDRSNPKSARYQEWLTNDQIGAITRNEEAVEAITAWLESFNGDKKSDQRSHNSAGDTLNELTVSWVTPHKDFIGVSASVKTWEEAFQTVFHVWHDLDTSVEDVNSIDGDKGGQRGDPVDHVRSEEYHLPAEIVPHVHAVFNTCQAMPLITGRGALRHPRGVPLPMEGNIYKTHIYKNPGNLRDAAYRANDDDDGPDAPPPIGDNIESDASADGSVTVALLNEVYGIPSNTGSESLSQSVFETNSERMSSEDLYLFQHYYGLTEQAADMRNTAAVSSSYCLYTGRCFEGNLDVQYIMGVAQNVATIYWYVENLYYDPFLVWLVEMASEDSPPSSNSISWGGVEQAISNDYKEAFNTQAMKLGLQGVTVAVASGDNGVINFGCYDDGRSSSSMYNNACSASSSSDSSSKSSDGTSWGSWSGKGYFPSYPATSPYVTAVGATMGLNYGEEEIACQSQEGGVITTGGGFSTYYTQPAWQTNAVEEYFGNLSSQGYEPVSGYNAMGRGYPDVSLLGVQYPTVVGGYLYELYGTSASAPVFAAMISLLNSERLSAGLGTVGFVNQALYSYPTAFNDVTEGGSHCCAASGGHDPICCESGFPATVGWDPVTGWGSITYENLRNILSTVESTEHR
jgi:tripeptidyl-peptidase-1